MINTLLAYINNNKKQIIISVVLSVIATMIVCYIIFNIPFLSNSFSMEGHKNSFFTYFVKYLTIYIGIFLFFLGVILHNKCTLTLLCYCYLTLLIFLFFIKGIMVNPEPQSMPEISDLMSIDFMQLPVELDDYLNIIMPIPFYGLLPYLLNNRSRAFIVGLICIILIEPIQLKIGFGNFEITDFHQN